MKYLTTFLLILLSISASAKLDMSQFKESVKLGEQVVSIDKAEIIINKMPSIDETKSSRYIIVSLKTDDGKKIKSDYKIKALSFPGCIRRFRKEVTEIRADGCVVRGIPEWAGKGIFTALEIENSKGQITKLKATATATEVH